MLTPDKYEAFQIFMEKFDEWVEQNSEKAFELFTGIDVDKLVDVKDIPFGDKVEWRIGNDTRRIQEEGSRNL